MGWGVRLSWWLMGRAGTECCSLLESDLSFPTVHGVFPLSHVNVAQLALNMGCILKVER